MALVDPSEVEDPADADDGAASIHRPVALRFLEDVPSWLSSGVFHLSMMLLLSLLVVNAPKGDLGLDVELSGGAGGPQGNSDIEAASAAMQSFDNIAPPTPVDLTAPPIESLTTQPLELATTNVPSLDAPELGGGNADNPGNGDGRGSGDGVNGTGSGYGTAPTKTQLFGLREEAESFVYVFDRSDSMNSVLSYTSENQTVFSITPLQAAKAELLRSLEDLDPRQRFQIILYNHTTLPFLQDSFAYSLIPGTEANRKRANAFVTKQPGEGGTFHLQPLEMAIKLRPEVIYLMTDGEAKDDPTSAELKQLRNLNRRRSRINVIHFCFQERPESSLAQLAKENRGQFLSINISRLGPGLRNAPGVPMPAMPDAAGDLDLPELQATPADPAEAE